MSFSIMPFLARLLRAFFIISPFYWLPMVSSEMMSFLRAGLLMMIGVSLLFILAKSKAKPLPGRGLIAYLFYIVFLLMYFLVFSMASLNILFFSIYVFVFYVTGYYYGYRGGPLFASGKIEVVLAFAYFCLSLNIIVSPFFSSVNYLNPYYLIMQEEFGVLSEVPTLSSTGFNKARTAWGLAAFFSSMFLIALARHSTSRLKRFVFYLAACSGLLTLLVTGSRGALVYIVIFIVFWAKQNLRTNLGLFFLLVSAILLLSTVYYVGGEYFRLSGVDDITSGRFDGYYYILQILSDDFWWGTSPDGGYSLRDFGLGYNHVHIAWVNMMLAYGVVLVAPVFTVILVMMMKVMRKGGGHSMEYPLMAVLYAGMVSTLLEPGSILSSGHFTLIWWCFLGLFFGVLKRNSQIIQQGV